jgi:hypothetical protein
MLAISIFGCSATPQLTRGNSSGNLVNQGFVAEQEVWIYYSNHSDDLSLYKICTDGTERTKLNENMVQLINVIDDWVFYVNPNDDKLYRI